MSSKSKKSTVISVLSFVALITYFYVLYAEFGAKQTNSANNFSS